MTINYQTARQEKIVAYADFTYDEFTSGTALNLVQLPEDATLLDLTYWVTTAFDSGTSDAMVIAFNSLTLVNDTDAQAAVRTAGTFPTTSNPDNVTVSTPTWVTGTLTSAGTAATAGKIRIVVEYAVAGRQAFSQG